jgi:uncharacterized membrane protein YraQ (UPF0718 family)
MRTVVVSLLAALLSLAIRYVRVLYGLNLATMIGLVVSEIALMQQGLAYVSQPSLRGLGSCGRNQ